MEKQKQDLQNGIDNDQAYINEFRDMLNDISDMRNSKTKKFRLKLVETKNPQVPLSSSDQTEFDIMFTDNIGDMVH